MYDILNKRANELGLTYLVILTRVDGCLYATVQLLHNDTVIYESCCKDTEVAILETISKLVEIKVDRDERNHTDLTCC